MSLLVLPYMYVIYDHLFMPTFYHFEWCVEFSLPQIHFTFPTSKYYCFEYYNFFNHQIWFIKFMWKGAVYFMFILLFFTIHIAILLPIWYSKIFFFLSLVFIWRTYFSKFLSVGLVEQNSFSFLSFKKTLKY